MKNLIKALCEIDAKESRRYYFGANEDCKESMLLFDFKSLTDFLEAFSRINTKELCELCFCAMGADNKHTTTAKDIITASGLFTESVAKVASICEDITEHLQKIPM